MSSACCDVIIVNYNAGELLKQAVQSVVALPNAKAIVIDNASADSSLDLLKGFASEQLTIIQNSQNRGFSYACNQGIKASNSDILLFLNPDARISNKAFKRLLTVLQDSDDIGMVGGLLLNEDGTEQGGGRRAMLTPWRSFVRATGLYRLSKWWPNLFYDFYLHKQPLPDQPIEVDAISGACMLVKREAIEKVGLWDEGYFLHVEDLDWCQQFRLSGYRIIFVPDAPIYHQQGSCSKRQRVRVEWHKHKGMLRFYKKYLKESYPTLLMWLVEFGVWTRFALVAVVLSIKNSLSKLGNTK